ncbi:outer membrane autotransporter barrel domain-containing protein [Bartonella sp. DB5-6]|uniref:autotransporter outer membrane beta-barrel domain-containing protein n=1 Tax=Bartonella sp. DB5-6 TaxID=1094755 RepID=UPI00026E9A33|nr:autotransporter outer membrane beta-barrel domain-containing protein [Bartonella sp. DB5-6]EJF75949.1 outer membrane autotransporter barrel domain-containing protein [Bartonella sp. DB5-6]
MIKVFKSHVCLCAFTTAIFSLLQNGLVVGANAEESGRMPYNIRVTPLRTSWLPKENGDKGSVVSVPFGVFLTDISAITINSDKDIDRNGYNGSDFSGFVDYRDLSRFLGSNLNEYNSSKPLDGDRGDNLSGNNGSKPLSGESGINRAYIRYSYQKQRLIVYDGLSYICDNCETDTMRYRYYEVPRNGGRSNATAIMVKGIGTTVMGENITVNSEVSDKSFTRGVSVFENGKIVLKNPILKNVGTAFYADNGVIEIKKGNIEGSHKGVEAINNASILLEDTKIKMSGGTVSLLSSGRSEISMAGGSIDFTDGYGISSALGGKVNFEKVNITGKGSKDKNHAFFLMGVGGSINFKDGIIDVTNTHGILSENTVHIFNSILPLESLLKSDRTTKVNIESSSVMVNGDNSYGIYFKGQKPSPEYRNEENLDQDKTPPRTEDIYLRETVFSVPDSTAIYSTYKTFGVVNLMRGTLSGRSLLRAEKGALVKVLADSSTLEGSTSVDDDSTAELYLRNGSTWILQKPQKREQNGPSFPNNSSVSYVTLMNDSAIKFTKSKPDQSYIYQTLNIGTGTGAVYEVRDGARIHLNTHLNEGGGLDKQKTDRLLIHGDVSGKTTVHVHGVSGSLGGHTGSGGNNQGISIIQVSGKAEKDSFELEGGYATLGHTPYQYQLYAYGSTSDLGEADSGQRLVGGSGKFWDFRLENRYIGPKPEPAPSPSPKPAPTPQPSPEPSPGPEVKAVVPQVSTYLLLPNALFHAGLINISNQNNRLEALRTTSSGMLEIRENPAFFVRGYGGNHRYASNLSALEYGYGGELDYNSIEAGVLSQTVENAYGATSFGIIGSYERLSLQPLDVEQSQKSMFNKWSVTAYGGMQWDTGFYADSLLSYGLFKGDVLTLARGKTTTLKGNPLSASLTTGKAFIIGDRGLIFDPQIQVVYQRLHFNKSRDIDNFDIDMGKLDQWIARVGGRLTKTITATDEARVVSFYSKLHFAHGFGGKQFVHFKDAFQLGALGSSLETGLGFNAQLSQKIALHGDLVYQHKLTKAGFSGTSFSGGLRYQF